MDMLPTSLIHGLLVVNGRVIMTLVDRVVSTLAMQILLAWNRI